jgi:hypothetical protein
MASPHVWRELFQQVENTFIRIPVESDVSVFLRRDKLAAEYL